MVVIPPRYLSAPFPFCLAIIMAQPMWRMTDKPGNGRILTWYKGKLCIILRDENGRKFLPQPIDLSAEDICSEWLLYRKGGDDYDQKVAK